MNTVPLKTTVLVVGGGPGGSYASTVLAREGIDVVLLEAAKHPREHVGESMLPSLRHFLRFIDLEETWIAHGFKHKPGACFRFAQDDVDYFTDFSTLGPGRTTWNVVRSETDEMLIRHAASQGVQVFEETRVESLEFEGGGDPTSSRPISATWTRKSGESGSIAFDWLVDASGRSGLMANKYLKNRIQREALRNVAVYGYWNDVAIFDEGGPRSNAPLFECLADKLGWAWLIPLHNGKTSIGVVMHQDNSILKKKARGLSLEEHYREQLQLAPGIMALIGSKGTFISGCKSVGDSSYHAPSYAGNHFRLVGDAAAFIDPLFSSGFHMALMGGLSAASTILASINGEVSETEAQAWHTTKIGVAQTRFLMVVLIAYRQMQSNPAMFGALKAESYGHAYDLFRPVYQGEDDMAPELSKEDDLSGLMDFTRRFFPLVTDDHAPKAADHIVDLHELNLLLDSESDDARDVMRRLKLSVLRNDTSADTSDTINGYAIRLETGRLGLTKVD
ncbi:FAD/NAD-binding domain-containing protein [Mycena alexandri]|uniref:FAD/NAD-binding domain-containing protein n=1 Tax=Mycena alexandri TaxID=1745969 RepID=A0AAD6TFH0_9AGAR|nr:FAD/NAD-binding domain-containing protein [Mycena alexandri]